MTSSADLDLPAAERALTDPIPDTEVQALERLCRLTTRLLEVPAAVVALVDGDRRFACEPGEQEPPAWEQPLSRLVVLEGEPVVVADVAAEGGLPELEGAEREPGAFVGVPLRSVTGRVLGCLGAVDHHPRAWGAEEVRDLEDLAALFTDGHTLRRAAEELAVRTLDVKRLARRLALEARTDPLTGLGNRRAWEQLAPAELARAARFGYPLSVVLIDLDNFKCLNDTQGHAAGDDALRAMAARWGQLIREPDLLARLGGDEFVLLLAAADRQHAGAVGQRMRVAVSDIVGCSVGVAQWDGQERADELLARADADLYAVKRGREG